jgi:hypothetical protein
MPSLILDPWYRNLGGKLTNKFETTFDSWPLRVEQPVKNWKEFDDWIKRAPELEYDGCLFKLWRGKEKLDSPTWAAIAFDYLPIPAMSAEVERIFSR